MPAKVFLDINGLLDLFDWLAPDTRVARRQAYDA